MLLPGRIVATSYSTTGMHVTCTRLIKIVQAKGLDAKIVCVHQFGDFSAGLHENRRTDTPVTECRCSGPKTLSGTTMMPK